MADLTAEQIAAGVLPQGGPYDADAVVLAAGVIAELVRNLNHATLNAANQALPGPTDIHLLTSELGTAVSRLPQLVDQLWQHLDRLGAAAMRVDALGVALVPAEAVECATTYLVQAVDDLGRAGIALRRSGVFLSRLSWDQ